MTTRSALPVDLDDVALPVQRSSPAVDVALAVAAVLELVSASAVPVTGGKAANVARGSCPGLAPAWVGTGSFGGFVAEHLPTLRWTGRPSPGYVYDPTRQRMSDLRLATT